MVYLLNTSAVFMEKKDFEQAIAEYVIPAQAAPRTAVRLHRMRQ